MIAYRMVQPIEKRSSDQKQPARSQASSSFESNDGPGAAPPGVSGPCELLRLRAVP